MQPMVFPIAGKAAFHFGENSFWFLILAEAAVVAAGVVFRLSAAAEWGYGHGGVTAHHFLEGDIVRRLPFPMRVVQQTWHGTTFAPRKRIMCRSEPAWSRRRYRANLIKLPPCQHDDATAGQREATAIAIVALFVLMDALTGSVPENVMPLQGMPTPLPGDAEL